MILQWLALLGVYYKTELNDAQREMYLADLCEFSPKQLDEAFWLCRRELNFMPKVAEIIVRISPEKHYYEPEPLAKESAKSKSIFKNLMEEFCAEHAKEGAERMPGMRWTAEDGWNSREESWKLEQERESKKQRPPSWHAPMKGPRIKA